MLRLMLALIGAALTTLPIVARAASGYPDRAIRVIIPFPPGGGTDLLARALQDKLGQAIGAPFIIDNRSGAGGTLGAMLVAKAPPDGYTLMVTSASFTYAPHLYRDLPYDAVRDFRPITILGTSPLILTVHPALPVKSVKEFLTLANRRPGELLYGSGGVGSNLHMSTELLKHMGKINIAPVQYKGAGPAYVAQIGGEVQTGFVGLMAYLPFAKAARLRGLAISTKERTPLLPDMPTLHESGIPGYDKGGWTGFYAPAAVPAPIIEHIYRSTMKVLKDPDTIKQLRDQGSTPVGNSPDEFAGFVRTELEEWGRLIKLLKL
jgi:tripartite-type tricarboxylate transporter receptor subunit TctC